MTEKQLKTYTNICKRISYFTNKILYEDEKELDVVATKVKGSSKNFPYLSEGMNVQISDPRQVEESERKKRKWKKEIERLEKIKSEIEEYVEEIEDDFTRRIFEARYIEGKKQREVANIFDVDQSTVSRKIKKQLERKMQLHTIA